MLISDPKVDATGLIVQELATGKLGGFPADQTYDLYSFRWAGDDRIVFSVARDKMYAHGLYSILWDKPAKLATHNRYDALQVLGTPHARPSNLHVWIRQAARQEGAPGDLLEINLQRDLGRRLATRESVSNVVQAIAPPPGTSALRWLLDGENEVRYVIAHSAGNLRCYRREAKGHWVLLPLDIERNTPLGVEGDPNVILLARLNEHGLRELVRYDTVKGNSGPVLHTDEKYDFRSATIHYSTATKEAIGLSYERQAPSQTWFGQTEADWQRALDAALPANHFNLIVSRSDDGRRMIVRSSSDRHPGSLYLFESDRNQLTKLAECAPWLPEQLLGEVRFMSYQTRDGLKLDAYVTLPANHDSGKPAATIVLPHGGPWVRDVWGYDPESQFFASRGYVVFRPNYRGSAGYDQEISFRSAAKFRKMHDDVTDGVRALVKAGIADPAHLAIVGGSFGGYLAVCGAAFEPDLYRCAVSIAGVFDWEQIIKQLRRNSSDSYSYHKLLADLGDPRKQKETFAGISPIKTATKIKIPVFVAHGQEDRIVDIDQSRQLIRALEQAGIPHESMLKKDAGHGFTALTDRVELYTRIESFLKKHL